MGYVLERKRSWHAFVLERNADPSFAWCNLVWEYRTDAVLGLNGSTSLIRLKDDWICVYSPKVSTKSRLLRNGHPAPIATQDTVQGFFSFSLLEDSGATYNTIYSFEFISFRIQDASPLEQDTFDQWVVKRNWTIPPRFVPSSMTAAVVEVRAYLTKLNGLCMATVVWEILRKIVPKWLRKMVKHFSIQIVKCFPLNFRA